jgi:hypothetical protein
MKTLREALFSRKEGMQNITQRLVPLLLALVLGGGSYWFYQESLHFQERGKLTSATLENYTTHQGNKGGLQYTPVFRFEGPQGSLTAQPSASTSWRPWAVGEKVEIYYLPETPEKIVVNSWLSLWALPTGFGAMALLFFFTGSGILKTRRPVAKIFEGARPIKARIEKWNSRDVSFLNCTFYSGQAIWENPEGKSFKYNFVFQGDKDVWHRPTHLDLFINPENPYHYYLPPPAGTKSLGKAA